MSLINDMNTYRVVLVRVLLVKHIDTITSFANTEVYRIVLVNMLLVQRIDTKVLVSVYY